METYTPLTGFYDLRAFDIPKKEFKKFHRIQKFLHRVETERREGLKHPQIDEVRQLSADYQAALFHYPLINSELL